MIEVTVMSNQSWYSLFKFFFNLTSPYYIYIENNIMNSYIMNKNKIIDFSNDKFTINIKKTIILEFILIQLIINKR